MSGGWAANETSQGVRRGHCPPSCGALLLSHQGKPSLLVSLGSGLLMPPISPVLCIFVKNSKETTQLPTAPLLMAQAGCDKVPLEATQSVSSKRQITVGSAERERVRPRCGPCKCLCKEMNLHCSTVFTEMYTGLCNLQT